MMDPLNLFGAGTAMVGLGGVAVAVQACIEVIAVPRIGRSIADWPVLAAMIFILAVDLVIVGLGATIALVRI
ncbi:hypothetical protein SAMN05192583_1580 [Sphingomonas gellani]|uniref:Uncharacterized protein n=1 Tax=Sphingomonas gellani TaxID=1166340 RepID=A0A1H8CGL1_9SPHN|nr:hypothetical protein [Sphingomonas gellani]SEM93574.1 hypothetical protein SAMN05192583_1580 [Sphingomonas gellani]